MDLRESILKVLREEFNQSIRRRVKFGEIDKFIKRKMVSYFKKDEPIENSINSVINAVAVDIMSEVFVDDDEQYRKFWHELKSFIKKKYIDDLREYFEKRQRDVDNEKNPLGIKYIFIKHDKPYEISGWSGFATGFNSFDDMITKYGSWIDVDWDEIKNKLDNINDYPVQTYSNTMNSRPLRISSVGDKGNRWGYNFSIIKQIPSENLDKVKDIQTEGELTERCWKGYTQKGMKTMFGKRYPNCVKKTK